MHCPFCRHSDTRVIDSRVSKTRELHQNIYFCFIDYAKAFDCVDHKNLWKILQEMGIPDLPPEKPECRSGKQQLELDMEQQTGSK